MLKSVLFAKRAIMPSLKEIFRRIRFNVIQKTWAPTDHSAKPIFLQNWIKQYWTPSAAINVTGQNSGRNLVDESFVHDLPFLLAENSGVTELDLSHNRLGLKTITEFEKNLFLTKIKSLNLSHNPLDQAARNRLPRLIRDLTSLNLSNCNLSEQDITNLITELKDRKNMVALDISNNQATQSQLTELNNLLMRNTIFNNFINKHQKKAVLDLEHYPLDAKGIKDVAFYVSSQVPLFFFESARIKEIKAPILTENLTDEDCKPLIEALKKNNRVTALTMDFRKISAETEQKIRTQLMFNKARQKLSPGVGFLNYVVMGVVAAFVISAMIPVLSPLLVFVGAMISRLVYNSYFFHKLHQASSSDFSQPENTKVIERGKDAVDSWLAYLNPKTYTPMAYLGYAIEKEKLSTQYDVNTACFKPKIKH